MKMKKGFLNLIKFYENKQVYHLFLIEINVSLFSFFVENLK